MLVESNPQASSLLADAVRRGYLTVTTLLLLTAGHPERIPPEWYRSSADQTVRTMNIVELSRWCKIV